MHLNTYPHMQCTQTQVHGFDSLCRKFVALGNFNIRSIYQNVCHWSMALTQIRSRECFYAEVYLCIQPSLIFDLRTCKKCLIEIHLMLILFFHSSFKKFDSRNEIPLSFKSTFTYYWRILVWECSWILLKI